MKPIPLKISVKNARNRRFCYIVLGAITGVAGVGIALSSYREYQDTNSGVWIPLIFAGIFLPFICVIGEMIRFKRYCDNIPAVWCVDCRCDFPVGQLCKTGQCPECQSRRVVGLRSDDEDQMVSLF